VPTAESLELDLLAKTLLAAVAHSEPDVRRRAGECLDVAIEAARPRHSVREAVAFFNRLQRIALRRGRSSLRPSIRDMGGRILRLYFAGRWPSTEHQWLRISWGNKPENEDGYLVNHELRTVPLRHFAHSRRRQKLQYCGGQFLAGQAFKRLGQIRQPGDRVRVTCRADDGFALLLRGGLPWEAGDLSLAASRLGNDRPLVPLGFTAEQQGHTLTVRTTTPEAIICFSAALARGDVIVLRGGPLRRGGAILVQLRDFDGHEAELPALACYTGAETWLRGVPPRACNWTRPTARRSATGPVRWRRGRAANYRRGQMGRSWSGVADDRPLALLAAASHPRPEVRRRVARWLDDWIEVQRPLHPELKVRGLVARLLGDPKGPHSPGVPAHEVAVRVLRLVFHRGTGRRRLK